MDNLLFPYLGVPGRDRGTYMQRPCVAQGAGHHLIVFTSRLHSARIFQSGGKGATFPRVAVGSLRAAYKNFVHDTLMKLDTLCIKTFGSTSESTITETPLLIHQKRRMTKSIRGLILECHSRGTHE